eukprot:COSAG05_NODE_23243_length_259_cov_0.650000_1_plen_33_part_10
MTGAGPNVAQDSSPLSLWRSHTDAVYWTAVRAP